VTFIIPSGRNLNKFRHGHSDSKREKMLNFRLFWSRAPHVRSGGVLANSLLFVINRAYSKNVNPKRKAKIPTVKTLYQTHQSFETIGLPSGMTGAFPIYGSESKWVAESLYQSEWWTPLPPGVQYTLYSRPWSLTIYMNKPVGPWFGQMVRNIQDWLISSRNRVYHL